MIDVHCHLLPGVDDGCQTLDDTIACIRLLQKQGYTGAVLTPHMLKCFPNKPDDVRQRTLELREHLAGRGIEFQVWPGGEVYASPETRANFERDGIPTWGPGRAVLIEWWHGDAWPAWLDDLFNWLISSRYQPVLAHAERLPFAKEEIVTQCRQLRQRGVLVQLNLCSIGLGDTIERYKAAIHLLNAGEADLLGTDLHGVTQAKAISGGLLLGLTQVGIQRFDSMTDTLPRQLLGLSNQ